MTVHNRVHTPDELSCTDLNEIGKGTDVTPCLCGSNSQNASECNSGQKESKWAIQDLNL